MGREINLKYGRVLDEMLSNKDNRYIINEGGTRSGKTYATIQYIMLYCLNNSDKTIAIVRKTSPALRASVLRDLITIFDSAGLWDENNFNKTNLEYTFDYNGNTNLIEFFSVDEPQKIKGRKRHLLFCNEANELNIEDFRQLSIRTSEQILIDLNPSDQFSWVYDLADTANQCLLIKSTYRDNPFIPQANIDEIEANINDDEWYKVYGLGERSISKEVIYTKWSEVKFPDTEDYHYGLDFGFNHPTALVKVCVRDKNLYVKEEIYQSHLTTNDVIKLMLDMGISKTKTIYCDSARPEVIDELRRAGFNSTKSNKDVKPGIDYIKSHNLFVDPESISIKRELNSYKWKVHSNGYTIDEPVKILDDAMDAMRYAAYSSRSRGSFDDIYDFSSF